MLKEQNYFVDVSRGLENATAKDDLDPSRIQSTILKLYGNDVSSYKEVMYRKFLILWIINI